MPSPSKSISCSSEDENELRRGPWTHEEDDLLTNYIANHGEGRWNLLAKCSGLRRTGKSCRLRWLNYLKPDVKRGNLTPEEQLLIFELHAKWGNRWSKIAQQLPGRTDNEIKNYWRTRIQKQVRYLKIDTGRTGFQEIVQSLWRTRFLLKAKESSPSAMSIQNQAIPLPLGGVSQYSGIETTPTTQIPCQGTCMNEAGPNCLDQHEHISDPEHKNGSCMSSFESADFPNMPQLLGCTTSQFHALDNTNSDFGTSAYDSNLAHDNAYDMDAFNLTAAVVAEDMEYQIGDCQMSQSNWLDKDFACSMWNMDDLWQFRSTKMQ